MVNADGTITVTTTNYFYYFDYVTNYVQAAIPRDPKNPGFAWDYIPVTSTLTFNDFEMSKDIFIQVNTNNVGTISNGLYMFQGNGYNARITVLLTSATLDPNEFEGNPPAGFTLPTLDANRTNASVDVMSEWQALGSCGEFGFGVFDFERSTLRVNRKGGNATVYVLRSPYCDGQAATIYYEMDHFKHDDDYNTFPRQPGSDYAVPDDNTKNYNTNLVDFTSSIGALNWKKGDYDPKAITIPIMDNGVTEFDEDFVVQFFADDDHVWTKNAVFGYVDTCTVTILNGTEPAGAVDTGYNMDNNPGTYPRYNQHPGMDGPVYAVAAQPDGKGLFGGDFTAYDDTNAVRIARALANGQSDAGFDANTGSGADGFVDAIALDANNNIFIGGGFDSFNGLSRSGIARLNPNGSLDTATFLPGLGFNGAVSSILIQPDGQILVAGDFTTYNNTNRNYIVRLNPDSSVDSTFDPGVGPTDDFDPESTVINSMALQTNGCIIIGGDFTSVDGVAAITSPA